MNNQIAIHISYDQRKAGGKHSDLLLDCEIILDIRQYKSLEMSYRRHV